jgi:hypothetical protein
MGRKVRHILQDKKFKTKFNTKRNTNMLSPKKIIVFSMARGKTMGGRSPLIQDVPKPGFSLTRMLHR